MTQNTRNRGRIVRWASVPLLLASLGACTTPFSADVSRFESQLPAPQGQTFAVVADDPDLAGGLEFAQYADLVEEEMSRLGYRQAGSPETANLLVRFDYGVDNGRERIRQSAFYDPWYGYSPYRSRFGYPYRSRFRSFGAWGYGFSDPWLYGGGLDATTVYTSGIDLKIDDRATGQRLFEGKAEAVSRSKRLPYLVPNLVEAMFTDFPGRSGETVRISIKPEDS
ncbi:DUF4136 domain-containing protein [Qipengyuania sp. JC766]|uniref:DUF4136 domain-containing protein n=1 Tax=Qipengyuania sp. JC766 TaxID=3232139 RepID=UPI00345B1998